MNVNMMIAWMKVLGHCADNIMRTIYIIYCVGDVTLKSVSSVESKMSWSKNRIPRNTT